MRDVNHLEGGRNRNGLFGATVSWGTFRLGRNELREDDPLLLHKPSKVLITENENKDKCVKQKNNLVTNQPVHVW